jgi:Ca-activated chloride channel family protein
MTRPLAALIGAVALAAAALTAVTRLEARPPGDQDRPTFRAGARVVSVDVTVRRGGRPLTGLTVGDFEVLDNGVRQAVADFSYEKLPIDVTVALDVSGSVDGPLLDRLRQAVLQLRAYLRPADRLKVITFNHRVWRIVDHADPAAAIDAAFGEIRAGGSSAILDALAVALTTPVGPDRRHLVVLFSDGYDTSSINDPGVLLEVARHTTPAVYAVLPPPVSRQSEPAFAGLNLPEGEGPGRPVDVVDQAAQTVRQQLFSLLAQDTGGDVFPIPPGGNLGSAFRRALDEFRSSYVLHFAPQGVEERGVHRLEVRVRRTGVDVRARREYVWR